MLSNIRSQVLSSISLSLTHTLGERQVPTEKLSYSSYTTDIYLGFYQWHFLSLPLSVGLSWHRRDSWLYAKYFKYHPGIFLILFFKFRAESETGLLTISQVCSDFLGLICHFFPFCRSERHIKTLFSLSNCIKYCVLKHLFSDWIETIMRLWVQSVSRLDAFSVPFRWCLCWSLFVCRFMHNDRFIIPSSPSNERKRASERKRAIMTAGVTIDIWLRYWPSVRVCMCVKAREKQIIHGASVGDFPPEVWQDEYRRCFISPPLLFWIQTFISHKVDVKECVLSPVRMHTMSDCLKSLSFWLTHARHTQLHI